MQTNPCYLCADQNHLFICHSGRSLPKASEHFRISVVHWKSQTDESDQEEKLKRRTIRRRKRRRRGRTSTGTGTFVKRFYDVHIISAQYRRQAFCVSIFLRSGDSRHRKPFLAISKMKMRAKERKRRRLSRRKERATESNRIEGVTLRASETAQWTKVSSARIWMGFPFLSFIFIGIHFFHFLRRFGLVSFALCFHISRPLMRKKHL